jgi:VWFA-related protein
MRALGFGWLLAMLLVMMRANALAQGSNTIRSETKVVLVDAVVTDKKGYVRGLTAKDFEVFEDDKKQTITSFSGEADPAASTKAQARYTVLLFDDSSMDNAEKRRARDAAVRFVESTAAPGQMIAILNFRGSLQVAQNFTDDTGRLKAVLSGGSTSSFNLNGAAPGLSSAGSLSALNLFLAVRGLARDLASAPGRKTLVLLSADSQLRPDEHGAEINAALDACNRANVAIYGIDTRGFVALPTGFGDRVPAGEPPSRMRMGPLDCPPDSTAAGCPGSADMPLAADSLRSQAALQTLSTGTGGFLIRETNDLTGAFAKIGHEQNEYYLIGYTPPDSPEGSCHKLRVKVNRGGTSVRARAGYCNARSNNVLAGSSVEKELESLPVSPAGGPNPSMATPFFYTADQLARVNLAMEIPLKKIATEKHGGKLRANVHVLGIAHRLDGSVAARFSESVALEFDDEKRLSAFLSVPFHYENQFEIVPGSYTLDVAYEAGSDSRAKVTAPLAVDPYLPAQFALSALALSRQYGPASDPRLRTGAMWTADRTPLIADSMRFVPSGSNRFKKTEAPAVYAEIYEPLLAGADSNNAALTVGLAIRIIDRKSGEQKLDTGLMPITAPAATGNPAIPIAKRVPIDSLPPGSYRLELDASDSAGKSARRTADFEIE